MFTGKMMARMKLLSGVVLLGFAMLVVSRPVAAQGCALCYTQAASSGSRMIAALKSGILILVVPPTLLSVAMIFVLYRKRNQVRADEGALKSESW
jgi:hypothetical protein